MNENAQIKRLEWRLHVMMAERGIRTATELQRRLNRIGVQISSPQLSRIVTERPQRLNTELLDGLVTVLDCEANDLLRSVVTTQSMRHDDPPKRSTEKVVTIAKPRTKKVHEVEDDVTGPKVEPFPLSKQGK